MNIFSRITASVNASLDKAVSKVENHEAIVDVALKETRAAAAKARIRYARVVKDGNGLRNKLEEITRMEATWTERAKQVVDDNEDQALQCVQKRNECRAQIQQTKQMLQTHQGLESTIAGSIQQIEQRLQQLIQQRNMMRSRHSTADAMRIINQIENDSGVLVDDALERWEIAITETEYLNNPDYTPNQEIDTLESNFKQAEDRASLKADLDAIMAEKT